MLTMVATQPVYSEVLLDLAKRDSRIVTVDADLMRSVGSGAMALELPERSFQMGVAEQNMIGFSAGLASCGKVPFAHTFGVFSSRRACDQLTISVAFNQLNVKVVGGQAGLTAALNGATHQSLEDVAIVRAIPGMTIVEPCDILELRQAIAAVAEFVGPVYLRMPKVLPMLLGSEGYQFKMGSIRLLRDGRDLTFVTSGVMAAYTMDAVEKLDAEGVSARVLNASTLKPLDRDALLNAARDTGAVVTVENHNICGGLGGAVTELLSGTLPTPVVRVGIQDTFGATGELSYLVERFGLTPDDIVAAARRALSLKAGAPRAA